MTENNQFLEIYYPYLEQAQLLIGQEMSGKAADELTEAQFMAEGRKFIDEQLSKTPDDSYLDDVIIRIFGNGEPDAVPFSMKETMKELLIKGDFPNSGAAVPEITPVAGKVEYQNNLDRVAANDMPEDLQGQDYNKFTDAVKQSLTTSFALGDIEDFSEKWGGYSNYMNENDNSGQLIDFINTAISDAENATGQEIPEAQRTEMVKAFFSNQQDALYQDVPVETVTQEKGHDDGPSFWDRLVNSF